MFILKDNILKGQWFIQNKRVADGEVAGIREFFLDRIFLDMLKTANSASVWTYCWSRCRIESGRAQQTASVKVWTENVLGFAALPCLSHLLDAALAAGKRPGTVYT